MIGMVTRYGWFLRIYQKVHSAFSGERSSPDGVASVLPLEIKNMMKECNRIRRPAQPSHHNRSIVTTTHVLSLPPSLPFLRFPRQPLTQQNKKERIGTVVTLHSSTEKRTRSPLHTVLALHISTEKQSEASILYFTSTQDPRYLDLGTPRKQMKKTSSLDCLCCSRRIFAGRTGCGTEMVFMWVKRAMSGAALMAR